MSPTEVSPTFFLGWCVPWTKGGAADKSGIQKWRISGTSLELKVIATSGTWIPQILCIIRRETTSNGRIDLGKTLEDTSHINIEPFKTVASEADWSSHWLVYDEGKEVVIHAVGHLSFLSAHPEYIVVANIRISHTLPSCRLCIVAWLSWQGVRASNENLCENCSTRYNEANRGGSCIYAIISSRHTFSSVVKSAY